MFVVWEDYLCSRANTYQIWLLLSLYANFITWIVQLSDCKTETVVNGFFWGHNGLCTLEWRKWSISIIVVVVIVIFCFMFFVTVGDICNAEDDLGSSRWDGHNYTLTSRSGPLVSVCYRSNNEQTHAASFKTRGKYLTNWSRISRSPKRPLHKWKANGLDSVSSYLQPLCVCFMP